MANKVLNSDISNLKSIGDNNVIINCVFMGDGIEVGNNCTITNTIIRENTCITDSHIVDCVIGESCNIGPYSRLRNDCSIGNGCRIGNFVEIKKSTLKNGVKVAHLSYIGNAVIGENTNIGCGVVFANYNGKTKSDIIVGKDCFVGSNSTLIAPIKIADDTYICAGTVVTKSTKNGDFVIGRVRAEIKDDYAYYKKNKLK